MSTTLCNTLFLTSKVTWLLPDSCDKLNLPLTSSVDTCHRLSLAQRRTKSTVLYAIVWLGTVCQAKRSLWPTLSRCVFIRSFLQVASPALLALFLWLPAYPVSVWLCLVWRFSAVQAPHIPNTWDFHYTSLSIRLPFPPVQLSLPVLPPLELTPKSFVLSCPTYEITGFLSLTHILDFYCFFSCIYISSSFCSLAWPLSIENFGGKLAINAQNRVFLSLS